MATALGVVSSAISIFNFVDGLFPAPVNYKSQLKIYVGLNTVPKGPQDEADNGYKYNGNGGNSGSLMYSNGRCPDVRLWDDSERFLGITNIDPQVRDGNYCSQTVDQGNNNAGSAWGLMTANDDAICMAYVLNKWPDGQSYGWTGGFGRSCHHSWYPSSVAMDGKYTDCVWMSNNGAATDVTAIQIHFPDFETNDNNDKDHPEYSDASSYCGTTSVVFDTDNDPNYLVYKRDGDAVLNLTSSISGYKPQTGNLLFDTRLVKSSIPSHSAIDVCESGTSVGPDFVSTVEGVMCDIHMPLCAVGVLGKCFDLSTTSVLLDGLFSTVEAVWKYSRIEEWNGVNAEDLI